MVQWQLITLEDLMISGFGRPSPRHGLQLLFWFANSCVSCELDNFMIVMKLMSDCQPENGFCGFHLFGNIEELLPVLTRSKTRKGKRQVIYFEVGNLNTEIYPGSANLPPYVRENYELDGYLGNYNTDRIIISFQVGTKVVETVYVTEHDTAVLGMFSPDRTHEISPELIQALQSPQLDLTTFLTKMGYYEPTVVDHVVDAAQTIYPGPQHISNIVQIHNRSSARGQKTDTLRLYSQAFNQQIDVNIAPFRYDRQVHYVVNVTSQYSQPLGHRKACQHKYMRTEGIRRPRFLPERHGLSAWLQPDEGSDEEFKRWKERGITFIKLLLGVGVVYLAVKSISWLRSCGQTGMKDWKDCFRSTPVYQRTHIMLDYVY